MEARYLTDLEWRICHAVNIYVYRNGRDGEQPILVHIPPAKKKNMKSVLSAIQDRVKYPVGYAAHLFRMDGKRIRHPCELEVYNNYVVASNYDKHFKCAQYGRKKSPLLVLNRDSKHVRVLRLQNQNYHEWMLKKKAVGEERPQFIYPTFYTNENTRAQDLPVGQVGNFLPPGVKGGACCQSTGGKTFRVGQEEKQIQGKGQPQQEFVVNTCVITNTRKPHGALKKQQGSVLKKHVQKVEDKVPLEKSETRKGQMRTKNGIKSVEVHESDILNANVESMADVTEDDNPEDVSESGLINSGREKTPAENTTDTGHGTTSEETLDRKYEDMIRKLKKAKNRRRKEIEDGNESTAMFPRKSNVKNVTKAGTYQNRPANGEEMNPPPQYRDNPGFLPDINVSSNATMQTASNTSWNPINFDKPNPIGDARFILSDGQLKPQLRHPFHQRMGIDPQIQGLHASGYLKGTHPAAGMTLSNLMFGSQPLHYPIPGQGNQGPQLGQSFQGRGRAFQTNGLSPPGFGQYAVHNGVIQQQAQNPFAAGQTTSFSSQTPAGPSQTFSCRENSSRNFGIASSGMQQPLYGHPSMPGQYFLASEGHSGTGMYPSMQQFVSVPGGAEAYGLGTTQQRNTYGIQTRIRDERSDAEVDIPYTPMQKGGRTYRIQSDELDSGRQRPSRRRMELEPVKSRNVAIQMGHPGQDCKSEMFQAPRSQITNAQRPQMIPVKVAYYTANGESHLDDAFILQDDPKDFPSTKKPHELQRLGPTGRPSKVLTSRVCPKTSNASTQVNRMTTLSGQHLANTGSIHSTGRLAYEHIPRAEPLLHSNQSFVEYFVSGPQETNSEPLIQLGDLTRIAPPTEFREIFSHSSPYRRFQNIPGPPPDHMDDSPQPDHYF